MPVPDEIRRCVAFLGYEIPGGRVEPVGTAFFLGRAAEGTGRADTYAVTAKGLVEGIRAGLLGGAQKVYLRLNYKGGPAHWTGTEAADWLFHPDDPAAGVAVLRMEVPEECDHLVAPVTIAATERLMREFGVGAGDEVVVTGLFAGHPGRRRNSPVVRVGRIAAMPEEEVETGSGMTAAYLVELVSEVGLAGAPVFVSPGAGRGEGGRGVGEPFGGFYLLGLMRGSKGWPVLCASGEGLSLVVPAAEVVEVISQPWVREAEEADEEELQKGREVVEKGRGGESDNLM
jgi:hypothetical protein